MSKIFKTSEDVADVARKKWSETYLEQLGVTLKVMSLTKSKQVLKVAKANATTEFLTSSEDVLCLYIYEDVFDRLPEEYKEILLEGVFSNASYDTEKERLIIDNSQYGELIRMRKKYPNYVDIIEMVQLIIDDINEEEKQKKELEKENKKNK